MDNKTVDDAGLERAMNQELYAKIQPEMQVRSLDDEFVGDVRGMKGKYLEVTHGGTSRWIGVEHVRSADDIAVYLDQNAADLRGSWLSSDPENSGT